MNNSGGSLLVWAVNYDLFHVIDQVSLHLEPLLSPLTSPSSR